MGKLKEALESAKERYCLYLTKHTHPPAIIASFALIESCIHNKEFFDAVLYARTTWETITGRGESHIPDNMREAFTARGAKELARALLNFAQQGNLPMEEKKETGKEAIMLARRALEIDTQVNGAESLQEGSDMAALAQVLSFFSEMDGDDETVRLYDQSTAIYALVEGNLSKNVAVNEYNVGLFYYNRSKREITVDTMDQCVADLELSLSRFHEAARIYRVIDHVDDVNGAMQFVKHAEELLRLATPARASASAATTEALASEVSAASTKGTMEK